MSNETDWRRKAAGAIEEYAMDCAANNLAFDRERALDIIKEYGDADRGEVDALSDDLLAITVHLDTNAAALRAALALLVGADTKEELEGMAAFLNASSATDDDKELMLNAISILLKTTP